MSFTIEHVVKLVGGQLEQLGGSGGTGLGLERLMDPRHADYQGAFSTAVVVWQADRGTPQPAPALLVVGSNYSESGDEGNTEPSHRPLAVLRVQNTRLALARLSKLFDTQPKPEAHPTASLHDHPNIHPTALVGSHVVLAPGVVIGAGATVGDDCVVGANSVVGANVIMGQGCLLHANVTLYPGARLGDRVTLHSGAVIGADGFGYAAGPMGAEKLHHMGGVELDDDVEVGANTAIDRGTLLPTRIGARTKIDNLCQIGHNVVIGTDTLIAGMTGVAGSVRIGSGVIIGGACGVSDHVRIGDGARIGGRSGVTKDVPPGESWMGFPAAPHRRFIRERYLMGKLEAMWTAVKSLPQAKGSE